ncbi:DUF488 domain-containing protein [Flammeovirga aprica]|uniref:DUF488 domain-containing protein n=1 Tax=Flammeovirga aprica JL-4 TaxID=694437 RepID=A0A7X9RUM9_9BACT|nr:DUF488 domain-containing protein [Flammeovirga aprica]NME69023.1 DUF488 domain-containing protein [Flammeovirga aprica JL-4]
MFYRRKVILAIIESLNGKVDKLKLQKLLFIFNERKSKNKVYDFVPFQFGCYSFSAHADIQTMIKKEFISEVDDKSYIKLDQTNYFNQLKKEDQRILKEVIKLFGNSKTENVVKYTYMNYPFYAINSIIAKDILPDKYYERILESKPKDNDTILFTIGYEGISLEEYLLRLLKNNVKLLVDVRKNPLSMKFGFSKTLLKKYCSNLDIQYIHIPDVGIVSEKRQKLDNQKDYDLLFENYKQTVLKTESKSKDEILSLLDEHNRIALTCFEADICQCHRLHLAKSLIDMRPDLTLKHI